MAQHGIQFDGEAKPGDRLAVTLTRFLSLGLLLVSCGEPPRPLTTPSAVADAGAEVNNAAPPPTKLNDALPLIPQPKALERCEGSFIVDPSSTKIYFVDDASRRAAEGLAQWLAIPSSSITRLPRREPLGGIIIQTTGNAEASASIDPAVGPPGSVADEAFVVDSNPRRIIVRASTTRGLFYGTQTLATLVSARVVGAPSQRAAKKIVPCVLVDDAPRFRFRAMHLDVARHFFDKATVERYIDLLAFYRLNVFHWHLTDDQGFRLEIKSHPELTAVGGTDGFFTHEDVKEIVEYARARSITVMPEIEMPGHARAILASHPELSCTGKKQDVPRTWGIFEDVLCVGNDKTYDLLRDVLTEVASLFPSEAIHVGGDEVPTTRYRACPKCRALMAKDKIKDPAGLEGVFMRRVATILEGLGRRPFVWDEALEALAAGPPSSPRPVIVAWQSAERGRAAIARGFDVVMAPSDQVYFDFQQSPRSDPGRDGYTPWSKVHKFDPIPDGVEPTEAAHVIGGAGMLWTERITSQERIDTMSMPRVAALAEVLWSPPRRSAEGFIARWGAQLPAIDAAGIQYFIDPPVGLGARKIFVDAESVAFAPPRLYPSGVVRYTKDGSDPTTASPAFETPIIVKESVTISSALFLPSGLRSPVVRSVLVKEQPRPAIQDLPEKLEPGVAFTYVEGHFHQLPEFGPKTFVRARGHAKTIDLDAASAALAPQKLASEHFALRFDGLVRVPADGVYRVVANSDDGVRVEIDGEAIVNDDGEHAPRESSGEIALALGAHRLRLTYFQGTEGKKLELKLEGPTGEPLPLDLFVDRRSK